ncbi:hypothetical protein PV325_005986 [Microctonus aethiopoides]|nr:hypothetical protein PV325_005986 [Microctonus aethiopoides]KAK0096299.1 hypothetical protein PV326_005849 [Microctonus aethiopoides]
MRKLNTSIDIIPLQGVSNEDMTSTMEKRQIDEQQMRVQRDPLIISRVQMYLYDNEDKVYIDVNEMADSLQSKYRDYRTKKRGPFRALVRRAYDEITESFSKKSDSLSRQDDYDDEVEIESDTPVNDTLNKELLKMYKKTADEQNGNSDKELIDISSDDDSGKIEDIAPEKSLSSIATRGNSSKPSQKNTHSCLMSKVSKTETQMENEEINQKTLADFPQAKISVVEKSRKRPREKMSDEHLPAIQKKKKESPKCVDVKTKFSDIGGNTKVLENVCKLLIHMKHPEIFNQFGMSPPRGLLLHGPPGCGKSLMAHAIAGELEVPLIKVAASELVGGVSGESESRIRELFDRAVASAPCVLFLDEVDAMAPQRANAQKEMERRMVVQLLSCFDELGFKENGSKVLVLGATNTPDSLDPALRRAGRFDREVSLGIPDKESRVRILQVHAAKLTLAPDVDLTKIAARSPGFVGADLVALLTEAGIAAVDRTFKILQNNEKQEKIDVIQSKTTNEPEKLTQNDTENHDTKISNMETGSDKESQSTTDKSKEDAVSTEEVNNITQNVSGSSQEMVTSNETNIDNMSSSSDITKVTDSTSADNDTVIKTNEAEKSTSTADNLSHLLKLLHDKTPLSAKNLAELRIENSDFDVAFDCVQPSAKREGFATVPDVTWADIGSLQEVREYLQMAILAPAKHSEEYAKLGLDKSTGTLLCGPPGCGKTLLAKAIANEAEINFISVKGPELLNMYVGQSENAVRQCFARAKNSAPCVIFFDEIDSLCPKRSDNENSVTSRVVNTMLTEMDGMGVRKGVYLMAATNRPDILDPAILRPGRFDKSLYVGLPTPLDRVDILKALTKNGTKPKFAADVDLAAVAQNDKCNGYTGADLSNLVYESANEVLRECMKNDMKFTEIQMRHIDRAFNKVRPSVREKELKYYEKMKEIYVTANKTVDEVVPMETPNDTPIIESAQIHENDAAMEIMET